MNKNKVEDKELESTFPLNPTTDTSEKKEDDLFVKPV